MYIKYICVCVCVCVCVIFIYISETVRFSDIFRGYRNVTMHRNGFKGTCDRLNLYTKHYE